ncbi:MAG: hypothetical protein KGH98_03580 [Candidatus Micrarchaeota archaeon]|nr:hypothetical protein [Candidatus Micrarchaeota archaeon]
MYREGLARITAGQAFLNPAGRLSRDISTSIIAALGGKGIKLLDATAATGIRGIRSHLEAGVGDITMLEINPAAYASAVKNAKANRVKAEIINRSVQEFANTTRERFDAIDIDPFGSPAPYLYDLLKVSRDGTHLFVTATDTAVLCGARPKACIKIYGSVPMHNELCHEVGIRILANYIAVTAAQFNFGIEVRCAIDYLHYMRLVVRLNKGADSASESLKKTGYAHFCGHCGFMSHEMGPIPKRPLRRLSGAPIETGGRLWLGGLYDKDLLSKAAGFMASNEHFDPKSIKAVQSMLDELDIPLFYSVPRLTKRMGVSAVSPAALIEGLRSQGFKASRTQFDSSGIKTDASLEEVKAAISN